MFNNLDGKVSDMNDEDLLVAMGEEQSDDSKKTNPKTGKTDIKSKTGKTGPDTKTDSITDLPKKDLNAALAGTDDDDEEVIDDKEEVDDEETVDDEKEEVDEEDEDKKKPKESSEDEIKDFLKARVDFLIKKGEWKDFDGREEMEWDEDSFAEIELQQRNVQKSEIREELLDSFGAYGRAIAEYSDKGGDPDKLIEIFQEQQKVEGLNLNIDTEDGQKQAVYKYQTDILGKSPERANKYIQTLIADKELEAEAKEDLDLMKRDLKKQEVALQKEAEDFETANKQKVKDDQARFVNDVNTAISKMEDVPAEEKKELIKVLTKFNKKLPNGQEVNDFYYKFIEYRKNLPNYINLVRLVMDPDKFIKRAATKGKNEANEKAFKLIRTANSSKGAKGADTGRNSSKPKATTFKFL